MVSYNCGSKDHLYRECPKRQNYVPQYQDTGQQQRYVPKGTGKGASKGPPLRKGEKGGKGQGKKGKEETKNQSPKGKGKRQNRPGARAAQEWDEENPDYPPEDYGYEEPQPEDQEQEQGAPEYADEEQEEPYGHEWNGFYEEEQEEPEPPENNESMVKTIISEMRRYAQEDAKEPQAEQSKVATATLTDDAVNLSSLALEQEGTFIKSSAVLLDGGASHHVYDSPIAPKGEQ